jgi:predicted nucleic acid-binding protein
LTLVELADEDLVRMSNLVEQYASLPLGAVDASVIAIAERLDIAEVATLDRRHFTVVRPAHIGSFILLPEEL